MVTTGGRRQGRCMKESNPSRSDLGSIVIVIVIFVVIVVIKSCCGSEGGGRGLWIVIFSTSTDKGGGGRVGDGNNKTIVAGAGDAQGEGGRVVIVAMVGVCVVVFVHWHGVFFVGDVGAARHRLSFDMLTWRNRRFSSPTSINLEEP